MKCTVGSPGELTKEFDVSSPQACRLAGVLSVTEEGKPKASFTTKNDAGEIDPAGTGVAVKADPSPDGKSCARVTLDNGRSGNICSAPSR